MTRSEIQCPHCGNKLIVLGLGFREDLERTALPSIELFCDKCLRHYFIIPKCTEELREEDIVEKSTPSKEVSP